MTLTKSKTAKRVSVFLMLAMLISLYAAPIATFALTNDDMKIEYGDDGVELGGMFKKTGDNIWATLFSKYRGIIAGISGIGAITMIVFFIMNFMKLGASAGNPQARSQALTGLLWTGGAAAGLGSVTVVVGFFYNAVGNDVP